MLLDSRCRTNTVKHARRAWLIALCMAANAPALADSAPHDDLIGIYSVEPPHAAQSVDVVRIERSGDTYFLAVNPGYAVVDWSDPRIERVETRLSARDDYANAELLGKRIPADFIGLETDQSAVIKLEPGQGYGPYNINTETGYLWMFPVGQAVAVKKRPLPVAEVSAPAGD